MVAKKHVTDHKAQPDESKVRDETLRHAGVENTAPSNKVQEAKEHNENNNLNPPPLVHVNPVTGEVLDRPLDTGREANRNTVPGGSDVKDARPNNGQAATGNPHTDRKS